MSFKFLIGLILLLIETNLISTYLSKDSFVPFGTQFDDAMMQLQDDAFFGPIQIPINYRFFNRTWSQLFVSTNGFISFDRGVVAYVPQRFPLNNSLGVAPYWADVDIRNGGNIYYREINDVIQLRKIDTEINRAFSQLTSYRSIWGFVATYDQVAEYNVRNSSNNNTFQVVLTTNGKISFTIFNYGRLMWTHNGSAQAGFNSGNGKDFLVLPGSFSKGIVNISESSNINVNGKWIFRIDSSNITSGGCENTGFLTANPYNAYFIGLDDIIVTGPCYKPADIIELTYDGTSRVKCIYIDASSCLCKTVYFNRIGRIPVKLNINNNAVYEGFINSKGVGSKKAFDNLESVYRLQDLPVIDLSWNDADYEIGDMYSIHLITFVNRNDRAINFLVEPTFRMSARIDLSSLKSFLTDNIYIKGYPVIPNLLVVTKQTRNLMIKVLSLQEIDILMYYENNDNSYLDFYDSLCKTWHDNEVDFNPNSTMISLPACWRTVPLQPNGQFPSAFGDFIEDFSCNPKNPKNCEEFHKGAKGCFRSRTLFNDAGQQCCYSNDNHLLVGPTGGGSLDRISPDAQLIPLNHFWYDVLPYYLCCKKSNNCNLYYNKRPSDDGSRWIAPRLTGGSGDPHFITLDELSYSFNGYGEYVLLKIDEINFIVQVRLSPYKGRDGKLTGGTVFKAIAIQGSQNQDSIQIDLNQQNNIDFFINRRLVDISLEAETSLELNGCFIFIDQNKTFTIQYTNNIQIQIKMTEQNDAFLIMLLVSSQYKSKTKGLLGVMDNDINNEFTLPNGTVLNLNASNDEEIFYKFGQAWLASPDTTIFTYIDGYEYSDYTNLSYIPLFLSNGFQFQNETLKALAEKTCGANLQCLFDVSVTGDFSVGKLNVELNKIFELTSNGIQNFQVSCIPQSNILKNGNVNVYINDNNEPSYIYNCNQNYKLNGSSVVKCINGNYDFEPPICNNGILFFCKYNWLLMINLLLLVISYN